jgi:hypothetical protein
MNDMKKQLLYVLMILMVFMIVGCKKSSDVPAPNPNPNPNPEPPAPTEQHLGQMFYHDNVPTGHYDIFMADLYIVPKSNSTYSIQSASPKVELFHAEEGGKSIVKNGIHKLYKVDLNGKLLERVVLSTHSAVDISQYDFEVRNVENITNSTSDDFAPNVNGNNQLCFVTDPDGLVPNNGNSEIAYMDLTDRVPHQITPLNGQFGGGNFDPDWKTDNIIIWSHKGDIHEVNIDDMQVGESIIPEVGSALYDPKYSPDGTMLLFNTRYNRVKNSYIKYLNTGEVVHLLPVDYFNAYADDNPTWLFSSTMITGHLLNTSNEEGIIYTLNLETQELQTLTDGSRDFRYVTPIQIDGDTYLIFSDWTDKQNVTLWISNVDGSVLRELNQTGDEAVFLVLGLPVPLDRDDMRDISRMYLDQFEY